MLTTATTTAFSAMSMQRAFLRAIDAQPMIPQRHTEPAGAIPSSAAISCASGGVGCSAQLTAFRSLPNK